LILGSSGNAHDEAGRALPDRLTPIGISALAYVLGVVVNNAMGGVDTSGQQALQNGTMGDTMSSNL
jgi:hypothetical protein